MRLIKFRIFRYRSIEDSGEIPVDEKITTFVGINESGKTNALRALRKLNNKADTKFNRLTEQPVWHFRNFDENEIFITATFSIEKAERDEIKEIDENYGNLQEISFSRKKNMDLICHFEENDQLAIPYSKFNVEYIQPIKSIIEGINVTTFENGEALVNNVLSSIEQIGEGLEDDLNVRKQSILDQIKTKIDAVTPHLDAISPHHDNSEIETILKKIEDDVKPDNGEEVKNFLISKLPRFIYFENIGVLDSRINLQTLVDDIKTGDLTEQELTAKTLLDLANLDAIELLKLSSEEKKSQPRIIQDKDTLSQLCNQASLSLSREMDDIWNQNEHDVQIEVNGNFLRLWVTNRQDRLRLQLEERSRGYQWYFSFYVVFNVESEGRHKDSILLLDEPALFLHALGQEDFLTKALPQLSQKNQIIYTTHSPFLLDLTKPFSIHTVTLDKESSRRESHISKEHWATDRDALFPLQSAVGYHLAQSMFIGKNSMIVEGLTDFWLLSSASAVFEANGKAGFNKNFVFSPAGGGTKTIILAKTYVSQELNVGVLLDSDNEGKITKEKLVREQILKSNKILTLGDVLEKQGVTMSLEDIFPEDYYLKFVKQAYKDVIGEKEIKLESDNPMMVKRVESYFSKNQLGKFDKTKPALEITKEFGKTDLEKLPSELIANLEKIFSSVNTIMK
ncbi:AAA family ATPase [Nitrosopumilus piranensis]|uniref:AAA family ATPase n=1 Tax=Nitrosopumilus piranensis TaxID=1582439 RepID=UPI0013645127|nr:AAA family ATPase [Nitrosopumilus piranensis]